MLRNCNYFERDGLLGRKREPARSTISFAAGRAPRGRASNVMNVVKRRNDKAPTAS
jgi:hypothetical protein